MGAVGSAILAKEYYEKGNKTKFLGFNIADLSFNTKTIDCSGCSNRCEVVEMLRENKPIGFFGDRCGKWSEKVKAS
jgi:hypothetical protein